MSILLTHFAVSFLLFCIDSSLQYRKEIPEKPEAFPIVFKLFILKLPFKKIKYAAYIYYYLKIQKSWQEKSENITVMTL